MQHIAVLESGGIMPGLRDVLARFLAVPGVRAVVLAGRDGLPIEAAGQGDLHLREALSALGASALGTTEALGAELGSGATVGMLLEYETGLVSIHPLGAYATVVVLAESAASLAGIRGTLASTQSPMLAALDSL